ncbi:hypothetical protein QQZ08_011170 [Neonectria magnoliae]|uniref:WSC domain-containing protein n=1 Tax=Neonectria magnoliae TaxID=2732573 RepID=A0ABR1HBY0_9HYPO
MVNHSKTLLWLLAITAPVDAFWRMSCGLIQTGRVDPIVSPGGVAGHVHKVSGASNFGLDTSFSDLQASSCTSCEIQDDKSAYWTPQLYYQHGNGSFEMVPNGGTVIYYLGRGENKTKIEPFPPGFQMVSGDSGARAKDTTTMTYSTAKYAGRPVSERVSFACLDSSGPSAERNYMWRTDCDNGMRAQIHFQSCWNGGDYTANQSHIAYMSMIDNGVCPPSHPRQLPHLFFEVIYSVNNVAKTKGGRFVFANGDTTGYGFHGDFLNGWNPDVLSSAIKQCINNDAISGSVAKCPPLAASQTPWFSTNCPERPPLVNETVRGLLGDLPGCNPVTSGPQRAPQQICAVQPPLNDFGDSGSGTVFNPAVGDRLGVWAYLGCAAEGSTRTLSKYAVSSDSMTIDYCTAACRAQGYPLAGLENSRECYCAGDLTSGTSYMKASTCAAKSKMVCAGNQTQWCGAPNLLTIWNDTSYTPPVPLVVGSTKTAKGSATYFGCWSEASSGRALSSDRTANATGMTNEMCVAYCIAGGYAYAGTEYAQECYCGDKIGGNNITDVTQCSMKCKGDLASYCGAGSKLSVWQLAQTPKSTAPVTAIDGTALYVGCYTDGGAGGRTLPSASFTGSSVSIESCAAFCKKGNYPLFGMEYSSECYCGYAPKTQATLASDGDCKMACAGNKTQTCGGSSRISVWNNTMYTPSPSISNKAKKTYDYVGCYTEGTSKRALASAKTADSKKMTIDACLSFCSSKGYAYMGLENGQECYCNNPGPSNGSKKASESACSVPCKGDGATKCGAVNRLSVYKTGIKAS